MYTDAPFGYGLFPHDTQITTQGMVNQSKQFDAINTKQAHVWIVIHKMDDTHIVKEAMTTRGYQNIQHIYWNKPNHYVPGSVHRLTPVIEVMSVGCTPNAAAITWNVSLDPRQRPNLFSCPSVAALAKDSNGHVINVTEKPPQLAEYLLSMFCKKGATVLIVGTGAGGCVKGALKAGFNVIGVENDEKQYNQLYSEMNSWVASIKPAKEEPKPRPLKVKNTPATSAPIKPSGDEVVVAAPTDAIVAPAVQAGQCFSCEEPAKEGNPLGACSSCDLQNHIGCMEDVADDKKGEDNVLVCHGCKIRLYGNDDLD